MMEAELEIAVYECRSSGACVSRGVVVEGRRRREDAAGRERVACRKLPSSIQGGCIPVF